MTEETRGDRPPEFDTGNSSCAEPMTTDAVNSFSATTGGARGVTSALQRAADATGVGFDVLYNMAQRESSLNPTAKAKTSSAAGLFQFIEQTWLGAVKKYGAQHGLADEAGAITRNSRGRYVIADEAKRSEVLNLRFDPMKAAALAGELIQENRVALENKLGRAVGAGDVYAAHFFGAGGAAKLLSASSDETAAAILPKAAAANRNVFYDGARARSVGEVIASIGKSMETTVNEPAARPAPETKSAASLSENLFASAQSARSATRPAPQLRETASLAGILENRSSQATPEAYAILNRLRSGPLPSLAFSALASVDATRLGERKES